MSEHPVVGQVRAHRIVPVLVIPDAADAPALGRILAAGGLPIAAVTLRTPTAFEAIRSMAAEGVCLVGAGTVTTPAQVEQAKDAGAAFVVSPGLSAAVVAECRALDLPVIPGIASATELQHAIELGLSLVKLFPAQIVGGPAAIRALSGPFPQISFLPTGGVTAANLGDYLTLSSVAAVGGSWMIDAQALAARDWPAMQLAVAAAVAAADAVRPRAGVTP